MLTDKTATMVKSTVMVAYPFLTVLLKVSVELRRRSINNASTVSGCFFKREAGYGVSKQHRDLEEKTSRYWFTGTDSFDLESKQ